ncbi:PTS sugar transporter subunit IIA, partial [Vagococcus carniphilus]|uniref:PTS sugar transporter subunit IIA n=1 Tax=Vagococcus carniphilus TaxID=218144 RepID=UPI002891C1A3
VIKNVTQLFSFQGATNASKYIIRGVFGMRISQSEDFLNPLYKHLELMIIRRLNNINVINPIHDQILEKYEWIYEVIASCQTKLEALLNVKLTAHDLSFLVVYFVGEINAKMDKENNTKVLIVYETRKSITNLISKQIKETFYFESVDKVSVRDLDTLDLNGYTLIISETRVDNIPKEKFLKVNSYLTKQDLLKISQRLKLSFVEKSYGGINHFSNVIKIIKKNTIIQDLSGLELELINELKRVEINEVKEQPLMIEPDLVKVFSHETHWEKAIKESTTLLYQKGYIEKRYEDRIIENIRRIGPYMIISPGIMLAHAGPQDGVLKDGLSITYFKKGIFFNARQEVGVNLIFTVALIEEKNRFLIEKIAKLATNNNLIEQVRLTNSTEDLHKFLSGLLEG